MVGQRDRSKFVPHSLFELLEYETYITSSETKAGLILKEACFEEAKGTTVAENMPEWCAAL